MLDLQIEGNGQSIQIADLAPANVGATIDAYLTVPKGLCGSGYSLTAYERTPSCSNVDRSPANASLPTEQAYIPVNGLGTPALIEFKAASPALASIACIGVPNPPSKLRRSLEFAKDA